MPRFSETVENPLIRRWQIGYRVKTIQSQYNTRYRDLPEFDATEHNANQICSQLIADFPAREWRLVENIGKPERCFVHQTF